jgi:hypothetical protein
MSKTPYEIRLELLKLANEILCTPVFQNRESKLQEWHASREVYANETAPRNPQSFPTLPDFPSSTDIVAKAEELKKFVDAA